MKQDYFSANNIKYIDYKDVEIDYKDVEILKRFLNPNGKIISHKKTGVTLKNQRQLTSAIKHARFLGLLPFIVK
ncbi:MAG: 30S ribosomal protein S18 [Parcubacteria group bacterium GW2011_GWB1_37_13]|nr:MAG: 30S ribosomal protein S18 [Parcubacteria group bacterium GW2011_GWB1_37_13]